MQSRDLYTLTIAFCVHGDKIRIEDVRVSIDKCIVESHALNNWLR